MKNKKQKDYKEEIGVKKGSIFEEENREHRIRQKIMNERKRRTNDEERMDIEEEVRKQEKNGGKKGKEISKRK